MGGKGRKRREKNYKAAHGTKSRLPPPPVASSIDALPSKLRQLMSYSSPPPNSYPGGFAKWSVDGTKRKREDGDVSGNKPDDRKVSSKDDPDSKPTEFEMEGSDGEHEEHDKKKKKRRKKQVSDLRFEAELGAVGSKRKERKKQLLKERKQKHKNGKAGENLDFPSKDVVGFGEVVHAPPKLVTLPKAFKSTHDASKERIRLKAVEAYRNRKGWTSRLGVNVPLPGSTTEPSTMSL